MTYLTHLLRGGTDNTNNRFAADLAALSSLCFAGYLGLLVF